MFRLQSQASAVGRAGRPPLVGDRGRSHALASTGCNLEALGLVGSESRVIETEIYATNLTEASMDFVCVCDFFFFFFGGSLGLQRLTVPLSPWVR